MAGSSKDDARPHVVLGDYDWIGFDLDFTFVRYKIEPVLNLIIQQSTHYLVNHTDHIANEFQGINARELGMQRGVVVDRLNGTVLKLNDKRQVVRGMHGEVDLTPAIVEQLYGAERLVTPFEGVHTERFHVIHTIFDLALGQLFSRMVAYYDRTRTAGDVSPANWSAHAHAYGKFFDEALDSYGYIFADFRRGGYFDAFREDCSRYLQKQGSHVRQWLKDIRTRVSDKRGPRLFLATNSLPEYMDLLMRYSLGDDWEDYFDLVIAVARKPLFFTSETRVAYDFEWRGDVTTHREVDVGFLPKESLNGPCPMVIGGNASMLDRYFREHSLTGGDEQPKPRVLYVGDHLHGDVAAARALGWDSVAIIEESWAFVLHDEAHEKHCEDVEHMGHHFWHDRWGSFWHSHEHDDVPHLDAFLEHASVSSESQPLSFWTAWITEHATLVLPSLAAFVAIPIDESDESKRLSQAHLTHSWHDVPTRLKK